MTTDFRRGPHTSHDAPVVSLWPTEGTRSNKISHNWCDPTTWAYESVRVVDEVASCQNPGTYTLYAVTQNNLIDTYHGKILGEDFMLDGSGNSYRAVVKVNGAPKTEQDPHAGSGGDYTVNYTTGVVTFLVALTGPDVVLVTYHYENGSAFLLQPAAGKELSVREVEVQFSADLDMLDSVKFQLYVGGAPYGDPSLYKTIQDFVNESNLSYPSIPALGGTGWRGLAQPMSLFAWDYLALMTLKASQMAEIRISLGHDTPFAGTAAYATFYCLSRDES